MVSLIKNWYKRKFSDPHAVTLLLILLSTFLVIYFFSGLLMPVFVAIALAFLLDLPVNRLSSIGISRGVATTIIVSVFVGVVLVALLGLLPVIWHQSSNLIQEVPQMVSKGQSYLMTLPEKYPDLVRADQIETVIALAKQNVIEWGRLALKASLNSISDIVALLIYLILVPLMVFFFLKDKSQFLITFKTFLPKDRAMATQVGNEMHQQIMNYIRGKLVEIIIIGTASTLAFALLGLNYALLLGVLVGLSVLVPYVGATIVTLPVMLVALFQWGAGPEFGYVMLAYGIIQVLDGNLLVPLLFSEAVNLHPVTIIIAVILFGGMWGFWGVFFAIPLATLVKAVFNAWSTTQIDEEVSA
ncbi:AI-2E family transporter [Thalassotalea ganghwensis]